MTSNVVSRRVLFCACACTLGAFLLAVSPRPAQATETGFGTVLYSNDVEGDFVVGSNNTREFHDAGDNTANGGTATAQSSPFNIVLSGIPAGANVIKAFA